MIILITVGLLISLVLMLLGAYVFVLGQSAGQALSNQMDGSAVYGESTVARYDRVFGQTAVGRKITEEFETAGITVRPVVGFVGLLGLSLVVPYVLWTSLAPLFGVAGFFSGFVALRLWIRRAQQRRLRKFVQQVPDLARVLSSATGAGLSITTAWEIAEQEMEDPARAEIRRVNESVRFGRTLEDAQDMMLSRLPSKELRVLASTLAISARSGGSLVSALSSISSTLEERRELKREVDSRMAESTMTGYILASMTLGVLFLLNTIQPGTVEKMTTSLVGQAAIALSVALTTVGILVMRRLTKVDV